MEIKGINVVLKLWKKITHISGLNPLNICRGSLCMLSNGNSKVFNYCLIFNTQKIKILTLDFVTELYFYDFTTVSMAITERNRTVVKMHPNKGCHILLNIPPDRVCFGIRRLGLLGFRLYRLNKIGTHDLRLPKEHVSKNINTLSS